jgi:hypothetical protein
MLRVIYNRCLPEIMGKTYSGVGMLTGRSCRSTLPGHDFPAAQLKGLS